jgi:16S rRNA A1518/A1519 N6-dimethyltransferase RsmA/KsgA/DIM1 with predicted DNA glycosylase/AP lyase activity
MCSLDDYRKLRIQNPWLQYLKIELPEWHGIYLPPGGLKGTVLDLGAGCGETVFFFLNHGASRVIAVEPDPTAIKHLAHNYGRDPRVTIIPEPVDFIKIDIEGAEKNMIIEPHFQVAMQIIRAHRENGDEQDYLRLVER